MTSFTDSNKSYTVTPEHCTCPDYQYRQAKTGGKCKHMRQLIEETNKAQRFLLLMARFDIRSEAVIEQKRAAYWNYEMAIAC